MTLAVVKLLDGSSKTIAIGEDTKCQDLVSLLADKLDLGGAVANFAIYVQSGSVETHVRPDELPAEIMKSWKATDTFVFKKRLHFSEDASAASTDDSLANLMYVQARDDIIHGRISTTVAQATECAGIAMQATYGDFNQNRHVVGFLAKHIAEFVPAAHLKAKRVPDWEDAIYMEHEKHKGLDEVAAQRKFIEVAAELPGYGATVFPAKCKSGVVKRNGKKALIEASAKGVGLLDVTSRTEWAAWGTNELAGSPTVNKTMLTLHTAGEGRDPVFEVPGVGADVARLIEEYVANSPAVEKAVEADKTEEVAEPVNVAAVEEVTVEQEVAAEE